MAGGADVVLVPEVPFDIDEVCARIEHRHRHGANFSIVVVAEGATPREGTLTLQSGEEDAFGHVRLGGISNVVQEEIERRTGFETRVTILGHVLARRHTHRVRPHPRHSLRHRCHRRGARRRVRGRWSRCTANASSGCPIGDALRELKTVDAEFLEVAGVFFG